MRHMTRDAMTGIVADDEDTLQQDNASLASHERRQDGVTDAAACMPACTDAACVQHGDAIFGSRCRWCQQ